MNKFRNKRQCTFLANIPIADLDSKDDLLTTRCKFNFHYMDFNQKAGQKFSQWKQSPLAKLLDKLRIYSNFTLRHWETQRAGSKDGKVFVIYPKFPKHSKFKPPKTVPHKVLWARFRIGSRSRLIGFVLPGKYHNEIHSGTKYLFDCNTFYVVFLDAKHDFCP